jgi:trk system potassium uptake protein
MKIVILGAGVVGTQVARRLVDERKDVIIIEKNAETTRLTANSLDCIVQNEDGSQLEALKNAGMDSADYFLALTGSDEINMVTCGIVAAEFPHVKRIARVRNLYFSRLDLSKRPFMGIDWIVNPDIEAARTILYTIDHGILGDVVNFHEHHLQLRAFQVKGHANFAGKTVFDLKKKIGQDFLITSIFRGKTFLVPSGETVIEQGDILYILGSPDLLDVILGAVSDFSREIRKVVIVGGGRIGRFIGEEMCGSVPNGDNIFKRFLKAFTSGGRKNLVYIEKSIDKCKALTQQFPDALVIHRDISEEGTFLEENLANTDLFLAVTDNQELNLLTAMNAKRFGAHRTMALVINTAYIPLEHQLNIDAILSLKTNVANSIVNIIRGGSLRTVYSYYEAGLKILEYNVTAGSSAVGSRVGDLHLPKGALIIFLVRGESSIIPGGDTVLMDGDHIGIFAKTDILSRVEELFLKNS